MLHLAVSGWCPNLIMHQIAHSRETPVPIPGMLLEAFLFFLSRTENGGLAQYCSFPIRDKRTASGQGHRAMRS
ncbi:hypothetical protein CEXT_438441 [Caerostris extrusa]|uniref:Uncharacterized protein n=1 Tax=Caerostris extrusa TaxID=172846 RepID=A0AAV4PMB7_CAEEX|nr:hypothetical protein CEXT_438441 [Caerostris extrusa]